MYCILMHNKNEFLGKIKMSWTSAALNNSPIKEAMKYLLQVSIKSVHCIFNSRNSHMTCDPAQKYCFTTLCKVGLLFYKPLDKNQFDHDATNCLMTQHGIWKDYKFFSFEQRTTSMASRRAYSSALKMLAVFGSQTHSVLFLWMTAAPSMIPLLESSVHIW